MSRSGRAPQTPSQTVGPFFGILLGREGDDVLVTDDTPGERIRLTGTVFDGDGEPVSDALVELWQANAAGRYRHPRDDRDDLALDPGFTGFGRCPTSQDTGAYRFDTIRPGRVPGDDGVLQAPHLNLVVQARGMLNPVFTRAYLDGDPANDEDPLLASVPSERRATLVATRADDAPATWLLDVHLQGPHETVFLDV